MSSSSSSHGTQVWVQSAALDAARNPKALAFRSRSSVVSDCSEGRPDWQWKPAWMLESSPNIALQDDIGLVTLDSQALQDGRVVLANEFVTDEHGILQCPHDLITLTHLHEPAVVHCLQQRYRQNLIYTATGPVLLALNPFQTVRGLYGDTTMKRYRDHAETNANKESLPPHVYQIADDSFRSMMRQMDMKRGDQDEVKCDQSILVSGESGAGKTVTTKLVMKYLAALSQRASEMHQAPVRAYLQVQNQRLSPPKMNNNLGQSQFSLKGIAASEKALSSQPSDSIESQVLQSNAILESFGNARTIRNDNSSRFGKFIQIQFSSEGRLVGAEIETYLLEKVRLITQSPGERNYHVFFEILQGMEARELRQYFLAQTATPQDFRMTNSGTLDRRDGVSDKETYKALRAAMHTMKFSPESQRDVFGVTAALLHACNLNFVEVDHEQAGLNHRNVHLEPVCHLLGVTPYDLNEALCSFSIQAGREGSVRRSLSLPRANKGLEALIKATYGALFTYLVRTINESIAFRPEDHEDGDKSLPAARIGVLDIFGFESFTVNSFEQLCINYCNEALQQQFNAFVLKNEQDEYEREGIEWSFIEFPENKDVLELIDKRGSGILNILDDQCRAPGTSDRSFASDVYSKCTGHARFNANRKQVAASQFEVNHYAGPVEYTTEGFVEKNRDELPKESTELLMASANPFVNHLGEILINPSATVPSSDSSMTPYQLSRVDSSAVSRMTVAAQFRMQLRDLRSRIDQTSPHYVRCLKPNDHLVPDHLDEVVVAEQLRCGGILEAVRVSRAGFTQHYPHADFIRRYRGLAVKELNAPSVSGTASRWSGNSSGATKKWETPVPARGRRVSPRSAVSDKSDSASASAKTQCLNLLNVIYRKLLQFEKDETKENNPESNEDSGRHSVSPTRVKSYPTISTSAPSWSKASKTSHLPSNTTPMPPKVVPPKIKYPTWAKQQPTLPSTPTITSPPVPTFRGSSFRRSGISGSNLAKVGMQLGKSKVFLRHKAFETLERIRSREQTKAATKLNSVFRVYLARLAYVPIRDAYRDEMRGFRSHAKEHKEEYADASVSGRSFRDANRSPRGDALLLIERYESEFRAMIHNPLAPKKGAKPKPQFKWMLVEGIWVKNPTTQSEQSEV